MKKILLTTQLMILLTCVAFGQYPDNESGTYQDLLTPQYYSTPQGGAFRNEINKFVYYARLQSFRHPLEDPFGAIPSYTIPSNGTFEAGKGPGGTGEYHKANDMHVGSNDTNVTMYAAYDGFVSTYYGALKYRDYLTITKDIKDSNNVVLGKMVTLYAHLDLALDTADGLNLDGQFVNQGDVVSKHLYSGTVGGPHLHFEIRYYRTTDAGTEDFYGFFGSNLTDSSGGIWTYGLWDPNAGYGFAQPANHLTGSPSGIIENPDYQEIHVYPNPSSNGIFKIHSEKIRDGVSLKVYNALGQTLIQQSHVSIHDLQVDLSGFEKGLYLLEMTEHTNQKHVFRLIKE